MSSEFLPPITAALSSSNPLVARAIVPTGSAITRVTTEIGGNPSNLESAAQQLLRIDASLTPVGENVGRETIDSWKGSASVAYRNVIEDASQEILGCRDVIHNMATCLQDAANISRHAAEDIIAKAQALVSELEASANNLSSETLLDEAAEFAWLVWAWIRVNSFYQEARGIAQRAAAELSSVAESLASKIAEICAKIPGLAAVFSHVISADAIANSEFTGTFKKKSQKFSKGKEKKQEFGDLPDDDKESPFSFETKMPIAKDEIGKSFTLWDYSREGDFGNPDILDYTLTTDAELAAKADWEIYAGDKKIGAKAGVSVGFDASAGAHGNVLGGFGEYAADVNVKVGAEADIDASIGADGAKIKGGALVGGKIEGDLSVDVAGIKPQVHGEAWAGVGAELDAQATFTDGKLKLGFQAGAAFGVGGKLGGSIEIDVGKLADNITKGVNWLLDWD